MNGVKRERGDDGSGGGDGGCDYDPNDPNDPNGLNDPNDPNAMIKNLRDCIALKDAEIQALTVKKLRLKAKLSAVQKAMRDPQHLRTSLDNIIANDERHLRLYGEHLTTGTTVVIYGGNVTFNDSPRSQSDEK